MICCSVEVHFCCSLAFILQWLLPADTHFSCFFVLVTHPDTSKTKGKDFTFLSHLYLSRLNSRRKLLLLMVSFWWFRKEMSIRHAKETKEEGLKFSTQRTEVFKQALFSISAKPKIPSFFLKWNIASDNSKYFDIFIYKYIDMVCIDMYLYIYSWV